MLGSFWLSRTGTCSKRLKHASNSTGTDLAQLYDIFITRRIREAQSIIKDTSHPAHTLFSLLPSGKHYRSIKSRTTHFRDSVFPQVVRIMNSNTPTHTHTHTHTHTRNKKDTVPTMCSSVFIVYFLRYHLMIQYFAHLFYAMFEVYRASVQKLYLFLADENNICLWS